MDVAFFRWSFYCKHKNNNKFQRANATTIRVCCKWIHPTIGYKRDDHGTYKHAHGSWIPCSVSRVRSKTMKTLSVLHYVIKVTLHYLMYHRIEIHSALELSRTALLGCPLTIERVSFTFTSKGKREFVPRDQVSPSLAVLCPLFSSFTQFFIRKNCFELFLSIHFLFWEILNLNLTFAVCRIREV